MLFWADALLSLLGIHLHTLLTYRLWGFKLRATSMLATVCYILQLRNEKGFSVNNVPVLNRSVCLSASHLPQQTGRSVLLIWGGNWIISDLQLD